MNSKDHRDCLFHEADKVVRGYKPTAEIFGECPPRFRWLSLEKPWYWFLTFWKTEWKNYGTFEEVKSDEPGYDEAPYEMAYVAKRKA